MKQYVKPMVVANAELAEGVYAASGCTFADVWFYQTDGDGTQRGKVAYRHRAHMDHCNTGCTITIYFSAPFTITDSSGYRLEGNGTTGIKITITNAMHSDGDCQTEFNFVGKANDGQPVSISGWEIDDEGFKDFNCDHVNK